MTLKGIPILELQRLEKRFPLPRANFGGPRREVKAVDSVDLTVYSGETVALIGESGSGKTTLGRCAARLYPPTKGRILFKGLDITEKHGSDLRHFRKSVQMVFQDPNESLNPRMPVGTIIGEPTRIQNPRDPILWHKRAQEVMELVGLSPTLMDRYPHEFSGGQRQRMAIARALVLQPDLIIADEPVSSLDVSIQSQILNLFANLRETTNLALLFITHDMAVVNFIADRVAVMYSGQIIETADCATLLKTPLHPYSQALKSAVPSITTGKRIPDFTSANIAPDLSAPLTGCPFHARCPEASSICLEVVPILKATNCDSSHKVACHFRE